MHWLFVVNPGAGKRLGDEAALRGIIGKVMGRFDATFELVVAGHVSEIQERVRVAAKGRFEAVVAVGGDGTVREVATGLMGSGTHLGILPAGSGNAVARELGIPLEPEAALCSLCAGRPAAMDMGRVNGIPYVMAAGIGIDAQVARLLASQKSSRRGAIPYIVQSAKALARATPLSIRLNRGQGWVRTRVLMLVAANVSRFGYNAMIAPGARFDDGLLDVVLIEPFSRALLPIFAVRLFTGRLEESDKVSRFQTASLEIEGLQEWDLQLDGDPFRQSGPLCIDVAKRALSVLLPSSPGSR